MQKYLNSFSLSDMLDFTRASFDKAIRTNVQTEKAKIESKYEIKTLQEVCAMNITDGTHQTPTYCDASIGIPFISAKDVTSGKINWNNIMYIPNELHKKLYARVSPKKDDVLLAKNGTTGIAAIVEDDRIFDIYVTLALLRSNRKIILPKYLLQIVNSKICKIQFDNSLKGIGVPNLHLENIRETKIPLPPLDIQQNIVDECETVDSEYEESQNTISRCKNQIAEIMKNVKGEEKKLNEICEMKAGKFVSANEIYDEQLEDSFPCFGGNGLRGYTKDFTHDGVYPLIGRQGALCGNVCLATGKFHATEHAVAVTPKEGINVYWLRYKLEHMNLNQYATGTAQPGLSVNKILEVSCSVPPLAEQQKIVEQITALEEQIAAAKKIIADVPAKKQAILDKWL